MTPDRPMVVGHQALRQGGRGRGRLAELHPGEATALVGHNGAGKTTLIKLLLGLVRPSQGSVSVLGVDPAGRQGAEARRALGFLPENVAFHGAMTGTELMNFYARLKGQPVSRNRDLLARVGLAEAADRRVSTYSKGMRQRLGLAQTLIGDPRLLLLDEPTSGLDPASRAEVFDMIDRLRADGATISFRPMRLPKSASASTGSRSCTRADCCGPDRWRNCAARPPPRSGCACGSSPARRARCSRICRTACGAPAATRPISSSWCR
jgi:energy-coupling factor transporter ATP-binding protein EcfA2